MHGRSMEPEAKAIAKMDRAPRALQFLEDRDNKTSSVLDRRDLVMASEVQKASFPQQPPPIPGLSCTAKPLTQTASPNRRVSPEIPLDLNDWKESCVVATAETRRRFWNTFCMS